MLKCRNCSCNLQGEEHYYYRNEFGHTEYACCKCVHYWWMADDRSYICKQDLVHVKKPKRARNLQPANFNNAMPVAW